MTAIFSNTRPVGLLSPMAAARLIPAKRLLLAETGVQIALALPSLLAYWIDDRTLNGISVWSKPLKFQSSLVVLLVTLLFMLPLIERQTREGRTVWLAAFSASLMSVVEIAYITLQAARGRASHFNTDTSLEMLAYQVMGAGATLIVAGSFAIGLAIALRPDRSYPAGVRLGSAWGLMLGSVLTLVTAFVLGSGAIAGPGHWIGGMKSDVDGLFLLGWSRTGGDLRVPHFFATHIMQALPVLGLMLDRAAPERAARGILASCLVATLVVALTFWQAVSGHPFL